MKSLLFLALFLGSVVPSHAESVPQALMLFCTRIGNIQPHEKREDRFFIGRNFPPTVLRKAYNSELTFTFTDFAVINPGAVGVSESRLIGPSGFKVTQIGPVADGRFKFTRLPSGTSYTCELEANKYPDPRVVPFPVDQE